jgi:methylase of polypeptide subunit release factors
MANCYFFRLTFGVAVVITMRVHSVLLSISSDTAGPSMRLWVNTKKLKLRRQNFILRSLTSGDRLTGWTTPDQGQALPSDDSLRRMGSDKINAGIRLIHEDNDFLLLWKTSNVALDDGERLVRPASISVADWISNYFLACKSAVVNQHLLSSALSGVVIVAKSPSGREFFSQKSSLSSAELTYEAVVHDEDLSSGRCTAAEQSQSIEDRLAVLSKNEIHTSASGVTADSDQKLKCEVFKSSSSGSHGMLSLITVTYSGSRVAESLTPAFIMDALSSVGLTCVMDKSRPYLSLTQIILKGDKVVNVKEKTPSKFLKLMRREEILFKRLSERSAGLLPQGSHVSAQVRGGTDSDETSKDLSASDGCDEVESVRALESVQFQGLDIMVSDAALRPRNSSAVLVREAIASIVRVRCESNEASSGAKNSVRKASRILDLGCGSGALLLAVLEGLKPLSIRGLGVGIDMDLKALSTASINADRNGPYSCEWVAADFGLLHTASVRSAITNAVILSESKSIDLSSVEEMPDDGLFDVIICNPPFLSSLAAAGRVTGEGDRVLVGGLTGMEPYIAICESVLKACSATTNNTSGEKSNQMSSQPLNKVSVSGSPKRKSLLRRLRPSPIVPSADDSPVTGAFLFTLSIFLFYPCGLTTLYYCLPDGLCRICPVFDHFNFT